MQAVNQINSSTTTHPFDRCNGLVPLIYTDVPEDDSTRTFMSNPHESSLKLSQLVSRASEEDG